MSPKDRFKVFGVGFFIGCGIVSYILMNKQSERKDEAMPATALEVQAQVVPGIIQAYEERRVPMESNFIELERTLPVDEKFYERHLILKGSREGQIIRVEEYIEKGNGEFADTVQRWRVMAADRIRVVLKKGVSPKMLAESIKPDGYGVVRKLEQENGFIVSLPQSRPESVTVGVEKLLALSDLVVSAQPDYLDE